MKNILEILKEIGVEVPADKQADFNKAVADNYKTVVEHNKKVERLEAERDAQKDRADTAEKTLKGFEGVDPDKIKNEIADWKRKAEEAEQKAQEKLEERDFNDALKMELDKTKFSSVSARKAVEAEIRAAGLKMRNGQIMGLADTLAQIRKEDASAFVDEAQETLEANKARFTAPASSNRGGSVLTKTDIMAIKDPAERQSKIAENIHLFTKGN
jgi:hypothetical protein